MSKPLGDSATVVTETVIRPFYFIEITLSTNTTPIENVPHVIFRVVTNTADIVGWDGYNWLPAQTKIKITSKSALVEVYNESAIVGNLMISNSPAGKPIKIYKAYRTASGDSSSFTTPLVAFDGEMRDVVLNDWVKLKCEIRPPTKVPNIYLTPPTFNHLPRPGSKVVTSKQIYIIGD